MKKFNWIRACLNTSINEKVDTFNRIISNIPSNFIPHAVILCDDKDPHWFYQ